MENCEIISTFTIIDFSLSVQFYTPQYRHLALLLTTKGV